MLTVPLYWALLVVGLSTFYGCQCLECEPTTAASPLDSFDLTDIKDIEEMLMSKSAQRKGLRQAIEETFSKDSAKYKKSVALLNVYNDFYYETVSVSEDILYIATAMSQLSLHQLTTLVKDIAISGNSTSHRLTLQHIKDALQEEITMLHKRAHDLHHTVTNAFQEEMKKCMRNTLCQQVVSQSYDFALMSSVSAKSNNQHMWREISDQLEMIIENITGVIEKYMKIVQSYIDNRDDFIDDHLIV